MAAHGYESERFESTVDTERYNCPICLNVVKDPVMCRRNEHPFCRGCIIIHLTNDQTCPVCKDYLTVDTLKKPSRFLTEILSELRIRCEFVERGCEKIVQLQYLEKHVGECGFAPVRCSNEGCQREVNRRDLTRHEYEECEHRKVKCHQCERLSKDVDILKQNMTRMEEKVDTACTDVYTAVEKIESLQKDFEDQQRNMDDSLIRSLKRSNSSIKGNLKKLIKVMESLPKKSKPGTANDDSDSSLSGSDSLPSTFVRPHSAWAVRISPPPSIPPPPTHGNTPTWADNNSLAPPIPPPARVNTSPWAENNTTPPSIPSPPQPLFSAPGPRRVNTAPSRSGSNSSPSRFVSSRPARVNTVPSRSASNSSSSTSIPPRSSRVMF